MAQVLQLRKAARRKAFLKAGITAPAGGGKTAGALLLAYGMMQEKYPNLSDAELYAKIAIVDTENGSGELYVNHAIGNTVIGEYNAIPLTAPFTADKYITAIDICEKAGIEVIIIDSTTHLWAGEGGLLEKQNVIAARSKSGNSYTAWREVTPEHNHFVEKMLQCNMHVIATMRSKMEYVQEKDENGNSRVRKLGLKPVQREGMEYEFTVFFDIDDNHTAVASKDRTGLLDGKAFKLNPEIGSQLMTWLETGAEPEIKMDTLKTQVKTLLTNASEELKAKYKELFLQEGKNPNKITETSVMQSLIEEMKTLQ